MNNDQIAATIFLAVGLWFSGVLIGAFIGLSSSEKNMKKEAVEHNAAEWVIQDHEIKFNWKSCLAE
jgi:hypothetical protein